MCEALKLLGDDGSRVQNLEKAYELVIIGYKWWPVWEPVGCRQMSGIASRIVLGEATYSRGADAYATRQEARRVLIERIRSLVADPTAELGAPGFEPDTEFRLDIDAMIRAETAAREYLIANTYPPDWMMRAPQ